MAEGGSDSPATMTVGGRSRPLWGSMMRGLRRRCPACGRGRAFSGYVKVHARCPDCGADLAVYRSDDAPAYVTILLVGHIVVPLVLMLEQAAQPALWVHAVLWLPVTLLLSLLILPYAKGLLLGLQWALDLRTGDAAPEPAP